MHGPLPESPAPGRRRLRLGLLALALVAAASAAGAADDDPFAVHIVSLRHQSAAEAMALVHPHLSPEGTVELRGETGLVVRDHRSRLEVVRALLEEFDHPARTLEVDVRVVEASAGAAPAPAGEALPEELARRLRELLRYERFTVLGHARARAREREEVSYRLGSEYLVTFRLGALVQRGLRLHGFRVIRLGGNPSRHQLLHTDLALTAGKPMVLGLAPSESSDRALMVVLEIAAPEEGS